MSRLDYVIWYVESLWRSTEFYRDMLGLAVRIDGDGYVEFALDNIKLALFERAKLPELIGQEHGTAPCGEIGFIVTDVDAEAARLQQAGADIRSGPTDRPWGERTLHIADPDGNIVEVAQKIREELTLATEQRRLRPQPRTTARQGCGEHRHVHQR